MLAACDKKTGKLFMHSFSPDLITATSSFLTGTKTPSHISYLLLLAANITLLQSWLPSI